MAKRPEPTPFETELTEFFGDAPPSATPIRDHVTFRPAGASPVQPVEAADDLVRHVKAGAKARPERVKIRLHTAYSGAVTVRVAWSGDRFHTISFKQLPDGRLAAGHKVAEGRYLSAMLHEWLSGSERFTDIAWRTAEAFRAGEPGEALPG